MDNLFGKWKKNADQALLFDRFVIIDLKVYIRDTFSTKFLVLVSLLIHPSNVVAVVLVFIIFHFWLILEELLARLLKTLIELDEKFVEDLNQGIWGDLGQSWILGLG